MAGWWPAAPSITLRMGGEGGGGHPSLHGHKVWMDVEEKRRM